MIEIPQDSKHGRWAQLAEVAQTDVPDVAKGKLSITQRLEDVESQESIVAIPLSQLSNGVSETV